MKCVLFLSICLLLAIPCQAETIIVDANGSGDYLTIQAAINDANNGDVIIVEPNTYTGPGNRDIDFKGLAITVRSTDPNDPNVVAATIIDCNGTEASQRRGFHFHNNEGPDSVLAGITITNGYGPTDELIGQPLWSVGGAIKCEYLSSPTITKCVIAGNQAEWGGGIYYGGGTISYCTITNNLATFLAAAIICWDDATISNCTISNNQVGQGASVGGIYALYYGGGSLNSLTIANCIIKRNDSDAVCFIADDPESLMVTNCTISNNTGYGLYCGNSTTAVRNSIIWGNADSIDGIPAVTYSLIQGGWPGVGNIDADPCFADPNNQDYHLQSSAGRWDPNSQTWVTDINTSPCIDAGDPNSDWSQEPQPNGYRINMGAFGGTPQASMSPPCYTGPDYDDWLALGKPHIWCCRTQCHGDADCAIETVGRGQFAVGFDDIGILLEGFLEEYGGDPSVDTWIAADFDHAAEMVGRTTFRVGFNDIDILLTWLLEVSIPTDCQTDSPVSP